MLVLDKGRGKIRLPQHAYAFSPCLLHPRTTPRPIPSAHRALAHPHRELSKASPRQSNLFFPSLTFRASPSHHYYSQRIFSIRNFPQLLLEQGPQGAGGGDCDESVSQTPLQLLSARRELPSAMTTADFLPPCFSLPLSLLLDDDDGDEPRGEEASAPPE